MRALVRTRSPLRRRVGTAVIVALAAWSLPIASSAQSFDAANAPAPLPGRPGCAVEQAPAPRTPAWNKVETIGLRASAESIRIDVPPTAARDAAGSMRAATGRAEAQRGYRGRRGGRDRRVAGLVLGALGGFAAGGAIGVAVSDRESCHCDNPALHGFLIGAPIGAFVGGVIGYALAR